MQRTRRTGRTVVALTMTSVMVAAIGPSYAEDAPVRPPGDVESAGEAVEQGRITVAGIARANPSVDAALRAELLEDPAVAVDRKGRLLFVDPLRESVPRADGPAVATLPDDIDPADAFSLSSRPGSLRTIFLDFDGHDATGSWWDDPGSTCASGSAVAGPYDTDASPGGFSTSERLDIIEMWRRVAEDFAPFDVDVTTVTPSTDALVRSARSDAAYGMRAVITSSDPVDVLDCGGVLGIAYLSTFGALDGGGGQPAWTFAPPATTPHFNAETVSHEVGHTLGLLHHGDLNYPDEIFFEYAPGNGLWAPIMGYSDLASVSHWSDGRFPFARRGVDDIRTMARHGVVAARDDHANTTKSAPTVTTTELGGGGVDGIIGTASDVDVLRIIVGSGPAEFTVTPESHGANLDAKLEVLDARGRVIGVDDPVATEREDKAEGADGLGATVSLTLTEGVHFLRISGVGPAGGFRIDPGAEYGYTGFTDYGSLGRYTVTAEAVDPPTLAAAGGDLPGATLGTDYATTLTASGAIGATRWSVASGALPRGLKLDRAGVIRGRPRSTGVSTFTVRVTDSLGRSATASVTLTVS